jgi:thiol:disulfide interchange protein DsbD
MNKDNSLDYWLNRVPEQTLPTIIEDDGNFLDIRFSYNQPIEEIYFYIDKQGVVLHSGEQILVEEENNWLLKVPLENKINSDDQVNGVILINKSIFLVSNEQELILDGTKAYGSAPQITFIQALIFAFIGGLILNLMPCVFPIISLKILSFVSLGKESKTKIRHHALSFCSGVLISFLLIGLTIVLLKEAGSFIGWGFQLQSPLIVAVLSMIMFAIGIILLTDIDIGSSFTRLGGIGSNSISGSFLTGVLAVIVASPCTAPFMGAALGYALIQPSGTTLPVFASLGFGFAFPYLILSIYPNLISSLPKPGNWMVTLKQFFAFPMFATSLWLIWIFGLQTDTNLLINLLIGLLIMSLLFWMITIFKSKALKLLAWLMIILVVFNQGLELSEDSYYENGNNSGSNTSYIAQNNNEYMAWESGIEEMLQSDSQAYLINFTAAWCITCQANDKIALSRPKIKEYMKKNDIKYIVADWTNKNNEILKALENYNRNGVPLYIFWKPGFQTAEVLPAILTEQILLDTFEDDIIDN